MIYMFICCKPFTPSTDQLDCALASAQALTVTIQQVGSLLDGRTGGHQALCC